VSIQKRSEDEDWSLMKPLIFAAIMDHLQSGRPVVLTNEGNNEKGSTEPVITDTSNSKKIVKNRKNFIYKI
jgi:hypothetical protein